MLAARLLRRFSSQIRSATSSFQHRTFACAADQSQREQLHYDVVIIGAGPAGLSAAIRIRQLCQQHDSDLSVCVLEKGSEVGAHILSGNVFEPRALDELILFVSSFMRISVRPRLRYHSMVVLPLLMTVRLKFDCRNSWVIVNSNCNCINLDTTIVKSISLYCRSDADVH